MQTHQLKTVVAMAVLILGVDRGHSQGSFVNLNFESPKPPLVRDLFFQVPITNALPGWTGYIGGAQVESVVYNTVSIGGAAISLQGPGSLEPVLQGSYTVLLQPNFPSGQIVPAIAQVGIVPNAAQALTFYASGFLTVSFAGQPIPLTVLGGTPAYSTYGGNVSAFAGQTGELRFSGGGFLDNIQFSSLPIPEPGVFGLGALGAGLLGLGWHLRRRVR